MKHSNIALRVLPVLFSLFILASCSSGSGGAGDGTAPTGTVGVLITDKPADPALFVSVNAAIESVELLPDDDDDNTGVRTTLFDGPTTTVDLLRLRTESIPLTYQDGVPAGEYCKIRLTLSDLELVLADDTPDDMSDNETYHPKLPGNGKLDLKARDCFHIGDGEIVTLQLDIDAGKSIHIVGNNNDKYQFRPVIYVDVVQPGFDAKLVRLQGVITEIDDDEFLLCEAIPTQQTDSHGCVEVETNADSAYFDNLTAGGAPRPFSELFVAGNIGTPVTVIGWPQHNADLRRDDDDDYDDDYDDHEDNELDDDLDDRDDDRDHDSDSSDNELDDDDSDDYLPYMELKALVVETGDFVGIEGEIATDADASGFTVNVADGSPAPTDAPLSVALQEGGIDFNGTRIVSKSGELLDSTALIVPLPVKIDGVLEQLSTTDSLLKAALIIVDTDSSGDVLITGEVLTVADGSFTFDPEVDSVCGVVSDMLPVTVADDADVMTVVITETGSEVIPDGVIEVGSSVGLSGECETGGFTVDSIVIVDDQRVPR